MSEHSPDTAKGGLLSVEPVLTNQSPQTEKLKWFQKVLRPHFDDWVMGPINRLVHSRDALIGFIFMSCAIDYLSGFWWGASKQGKVRKAYIGFIDAYFPNGLYDADGLYDSLRNGLVHMFTIKDKKYVLIHNHPEIHLKKAKANKEQIVLNAGNFRDELVAAKNKFFDDVESSPELLNKVLDRYNRDGFLGASLIEISS